MNERQNNVLEKEINKESKPNSRFLSSSEHQRIKASLQAGDPLVSRFYAALYKRVYERVATKGLLGPDATVAWYYPAAEYLSDAAMLYALFPEEKLAVWLRTVTLDIARTSAYDWVGPAFRDHSDPLTGHLETAHLCWALSAVYDLARDAFSESEQAEIRQALTEKGIVLCRRWIDKNTHLANWRGILMSGVLVAASVLGNDELVDEYVSEWQRCALAFQPDGSYGESLQYGNYLAFALMMAYESLSRTYPEKAALLDVGTYAKGIRWVVSSMFYAKPLSGGNGYDWGNEPRARAANFNDSAALFRPSGDLLLHLAVRAGTDDEKQLARGLFTIYYEPSERRPGPTQGPHELATFGMHNDWGFLTLPLLTYETKAISPQEVGLPLTTAFSNGHTFMRDAWDSLSRPGGSLPGSSGGRTIVAINGGGDGLHGPGHLHGDLNSFILVYNRERLLVDPGHSCYRNLIHGLESSTQTHNTCTFLVEAETLGLQEDMAKSTMLEQKSVLPRRLLVNGVPGPPVDRKNRRLLVDRDDVVSVVGSEIGKACGAPIQRFSRFWLMAGSNVLFVVDRIEATQPVTTVWNWLVNNRDGQAQVDTQPACLTVRRNEAGMKLFHCGRGKIGHPVYGYVHDAYHVEPNQYGEGKPGSGLLYRWTESAPATTRTVLHAIALDDAIVLDRWALTEEGNAFTLSNGQKKWTLIVQDEEANQLSIVSGHGRRWDVLRQENDTYSLNRIVANE
ncbi:heparinase II/III domain-containing protein [Spirosoma fluviale]|uniref:Heparinase II/III-like protein n=1 Tax=Spirosoma fluviale TaxID=1597977 RepID=A0A286GV84_9BACT|nr:heparinase II/III family protein [Spirosoma fluviale]SOD99382.1 Heparinase II/III-like protein [Spirosoma fluviale]